jgi:hypothetical protein
MVLPEAIVAYLLSTIIKCPPSITYRMHLEQIAKCCAIVGKDAYIILCSQRYNMLRPLVRTKPIRCNLYDIRFADKVVMRNLPLWKLESRIRSFQLNEQLLTSEMISAVRNNINQFSSFAEVHALLNGPKTSPKLFSCTKEILEGIVGQVRVYDPSAWPSVYSKLLSFLDTLRFNAKATMQNKLVLSAIMSDIRLILSGYRVSPSIEVMAEVLGPNTLQRFISALESS